MGSFVSLLAQILRHRRMYTVLVDQRPIQHDVPVLRTSCPQQSRCRKCSHGHKTHTRTLELDSSQSRSILSCPCQIRQTCALRVGGVEEACIRGGGGRCVLDKMSGTTARQMPAFKTSGKRIPRNPKYSNVRGKVRECAKASACVFRERVWSLRPPLMQLGTATDLALHDRFPASVVVELVIDSPYYSLSRREQGAQEVFFAPTTLRTILLLLRSKVCCCEVVSSKVCTARCRWLHLVCSVWTTFPRSCDETTRGNDQISGR